MNFVGVEDQGTLIEQSPKYSNKTLSISSANFKCISAYRCIHAFNEVYWPGI